MAKPILIGAVAYDPRVVPIWEGMRDYFRESGSPIDYVLYSNYDRLVQSLLDRHIDIAWTAQRAAEVPKTLTALTDLWILFSQVEPRDLSALADRCGREVADRVAGLGLHDFFVFDAVSHEVVEPSSRFLKR